MLLCAVCPLRRCRSRWRSRLRRAHGFCRRSAIYARSGGFTSPIDVTNAGDARLFVVERAVSIKIIHPILGPRHSTPVASSRRRAVSKACSAPRSIRSTRATASSRDYTRASDGAERRPPSKALERSEPSPILAAHGCCSAIPDPYSNHNAGWLAFKGEVLYITQGDGGGGGDPETAPRIGTRCSARSCASGRYDPDGAGPLTYSIPSTNPFVGRDGADEIWSYGLRNPWRCSFDSPRASSTAATSARVRTKRSNRVKTGRGINFGWRLLEGRHYYNYPGRNPGELCTSGCLKRPIAEYAHGDFGGGNCAVTGGYVSRRSARHCTAVLLGDFCSGKVWTIPSNFPLGAALPAPTADTDVEHQLVRAGLRRADLPRRSQWSDLPPRRELITEPRWEPGPCDASRPCRRRRWTVPRRARNWT